VTTEPPEEVGPDSSTSSPEPSAPEQDTETIRMARDVAPAAAPPAAAPPAATPPASPPGSVPSAPAVLWAQPSSAPSRLEVPGAPGLSFADTASRFVAWLIDSLIVGVIGFIVAAALGYSQTTIIRSASSISTNTSVGGVAFAVAFALVGLVYFVFFWTGGRRATPGQRIFHLQVGNAFDGHGLTPIQAVRRWIGYGTWIGLFAIVWTGSTLVELIWVIGLLVTTVRSPTKQGLHDRFANSAVVRPSSDSSRGLVTCCLVLILIIVALSILSIVALILLGSQFSEILRNAGNQV
jgi:uncharacterized RDD family membrane protein YckC